MTGKQKKQLISKRIENGDARSYNEIAADLELDIWRERSMPMFQFRNSYPKNNRKSTNGRRVQIVGKKQIRHLQ